MRLIGLDWCYYCSMEFWMSVCFCSAVFPGLASLKEVWGFIVLENTGIDLLLLRSRASERMSCSGGLIKLLLYTGFSPSTFLVPYYVCMYRMGET